MPFPKLASLAVVIKNEHLLLVKRKNEPDAGLWGFPGGHVDYGETVGDAACRELLEETMILASPEKILTGLDTIIRDEAGDTRFHYYMVAVLCSYQSGEPCGRDDVFEASWIPYPDIYNKRIPLSEDVDTILDLALHPS